MPVHASRRREAVAGWLMDIAGFVAIVAFTIGIGMLAGGIVS